MISRLANHSLRLITVVLTVSVFVVSSARGQGAADAARHAAEENDIRDAVIRYQMEEWARQGDKNERDVKDKRDKAVAKQLNFRVFFVSINGKDPSDDFLKRFASVPRTIKKRSQAKMSSPNMEWVTDKDTHQPGIIFSAGEIRWTKESEVEAEGGYHCGRLCGAGDVFTVQLQNGRWRVIQKRMKWIS
jgi:hypothetical protein